MRMLILCTTALATLASAGEAAADPFTWPAELEPWQRSAPPAWWAARHARETLGRFDLAKPHYQALLDGGATGELRARALEGLVRAAWYTDVAAVTDSAWTALTSEFPEHERTRFLRDWNVRTIHLGRLPGATHWHWTWIDQELDDRGEVLRRDLPQTEALRVPLDPGAGRLRIDAITLHLAVRQVSPRAP